MRFTTAATLALGATAAFAQNDQGGQSGGQSGGQNGQSGQSGKDMLSMALQVLSGQCRGAVYRFLSSESDTGKCLHTGIIWAAINTNSDLVPYADRWLEESCQANGCSNETVAGATQAVQTACQQDMTKFGLTNQTLGMVFSLYPVAREIACLQTNMTAGQNSSMNGTAGGNSSTPTSSMMPNASSSMASAVGNATDSAGSVAGAATSGAGSVAGAATSGAGSLAGAATSLAGSVARRQETAAATTTAAAAGATTEAPTMTPMSNPPSEMSTMMPSATSSVGNGTTGAGNSTANATMVKNWCLTNDIKMLNKGIGQNITMPWVLKTLFGALTGNASQALMPFSKIPTTALCDPCIYGAYSLLQQGAPLVTQLKINNDSIANWMNGTCASQGFNSSAAGMLPAGVWPAAKNSTYTHPITYYNQTTGAWDTTTPNNSSSNSTSSGNSSETTMPVSSMMPTSTDMPASGSASVTLPAAATGGPGPASAAPEGAATTSPPARKRRFSF